MPGTAAGHVALEAADRLRGDLFVRRLLASSRSPDRTMFGLSRIPSGCDALVAQLGEDGVQRARRDLEAALDRVVAVHQDLRLDDRHEAGLL